MASSPLEALKPDRPASVSSLVALQISQGILNLVLAVAVAFFGKSGSLAYIVLLLTYVLGVRFIFLAIGFFLGRYLALIVNFISSLIELVFLLVNLAAGFDQAVFPGNPLANAAEVVDFALVITFLIGTSFAGVLNYFAQMRAFRRLSSPPRLRGPFPTNPFNTTITAGLQNFLAPQFGFGQQPFIPNQFSLFTLFRSGGNPIPIIPAGSNG